MKKLLVIQSIEKYYGNKKYIQKVLDDVSFCVEKGEFIAVMGPSGSGKTTLLNCISTIDAVTSGKITIDGEELSAKKTKHLEKFRRERLGFVFQDYNLLDNLNVYENIAIALTIKRYPLGEIKNRTRRVAEMLGIEAILEKYPHQISGGQRQKTACARALVKEPSIIFVDEPTGALDSKSSRILLESFERLNREQKSTIIMVTHDSIAASYSKRVLFLKDGKIFTELIRGDDSRKEFFSSIISVMTLLGGEINVG